MAAIRLLIGGVFTISFFVFVIFFGRLPALRRTPIAALYKLICVHIPNALLALDQRLTSGSISRSLVGFTNFMMHDRHPTVVVLFLVIMLGSEYLYLPSIWSRIGTLAQFSVIITVASPYIFLYLACAADPGYITPGNHSYYMSLYPYDYTLFHPGQMCSTCNFLKPARSKHCSICKRCIAKADHHCIFINSCVGYGNHHWFLLLLTSTSVLTSYGGVLGLSLIASDLHSRFPAWNPWPGHNNATDMPWSQYMAIWGWGIQRNAPFGATTLLALMCTPLVVGLTVYTFYLVYCGTSTNETLKWSDWKEDIQDGYAFGRKLPSSRERDYEEEPICDRWPVEPQQIMVLSTDGRPPPTRILLAGEGEWERVESMRSVENLYDMGMWDNLCDAFLPDYSFGSGGGGGVKNRTQAGRRTFATRDQGLVSYPP